MTGTNAPGDSISSGWTRGDPGKDPLLEQECRHCFKAVPEDEARGCPDCGDLRCDECFEDHCERGDDDA